MKTRLTGATFNASAKTITHTSFSDVTLAGIQLITNVTDQVIIYNFADTTKGGTLSTDTLTLEYDTTSMSDTDELMILVEDGSASTAINDGGNTITVDGTVSVTGVSTAANQTTIIGHLDGVEGLLTTIDADTGTIATEVAGLLTDTELRATPVPVSGTVAVTNAGITTIAGAVSGTEMQVDVLTMPTVTVTATNLDVQSGGADLATSTQAGSIQTAVELIDDTVQVLGTDTYTEATSKGVTIGAVRRDADTTLVNTTNEFGPLQMDANGRLKVEAFSGETLPVSLTSTTVTGTVAVTQSGTWDEVGINDSGNSITVDYATTGSGTATGALRVELPTNGTGVIATVGAVTAITNALPAGTNAIGKLAANADVNIGSTKGLPSDIDINGSNANHADKYYTNAGAVTDGIIWSPAAGKRWHVLTLYINVSAAATVTIEDDLAGGDVARWKGELAANSGVVLKYDKEHPFCSTEDAADLIITTSAGNVYVQAVGYEV